MAKSVLITGCSTGGIGHATASQLAAKGYNVFATVRSAAKAGDLASADNVTVLGCAVRQRTTLTAFLPLLHLARRPLRAATRCPSGQNKRQDPLGP